MPKVYRPLPPLSEADKVRFESKVERPEEGCHLYTAGKDSDGYGLFKYAKRTVGAHRVAWITAFDRPIPDGMCVIHKCDVPACCRLDHLRLGTNAENTQDRHRKGRNAAGERHGRAKLTDEKVRQIRQLTDQLSDRKIAKLVGIHHSIVWRILAGKIWAHVK